MASINNDNCNAVGGGGGWVRLLQVIIEEFGAISGYCQVINLVSKFKANVLKLKVNAISTNAEGSDNSVKMFRNRRATRNLSDCGTAWGKLYKHMEQWPSWAADSRLDKLSVFLNPES
jgi:hypothetical protein